MKDKEQIVYMIGESENSYPSGVAYRKESDARDAAIRFSENKGKPYYVHEVAIVYNTLYAVGTNSEKSD